MQYKYTPPWFLQNQSADTIHKRMLDALPEDIDKSELQIPWDYTRPSAIEKAEFIGFELNEAIQLIFPHWSYGEWLDLHAEQARVRRKEANKASGELIIKGSAGTVIPKGFQFATPASLTPSVIYETTRETVLDGTPDEQNRVTAAVSIQASVGGTAGNAPPDAVKLMVRPISGISYVTNPAAITGGTPEEGDDSLKERILAALRQGSSYVGNNADYIRWAKEVAGVGEAICIPESFGAGTVKLIIVDGNGMPANQQILDAVYSYIMGTGASDTARRAPIGATLTVAAPAGIEISITAEVTFKPDENLDTVITRFKNSLIAYWNIVAQETRENEAQTGYVRWVKVGAALSDTPGVADYTGLLIDGGTDNIRITQEQYPVTGAITINGAEVFAGG